MTKGERFDIHQHITDQIVASIERGTGEFRLPWHRAKGSILRPTNVASKKPYRGVNIVALWAAAEANGFTSGVWGTYRQWAAIGAQVRKGEKASFIVFYKEFTVAAAEPEDEDETRYVAKGTPVFAAEQVEGYTAPVMEAPTSVIEPIERAEALVSGTGAAFNYGGSRAFYRPATDTIQLPPREAFIGTATSSPAESFYSTLLHELTHWTAPAHRCARELGKRFGDRAYAMEELVAELGAAFLCAELGIADGPRVDHAQYVANWLTVLKADKKAIFAAASKASQAAEFLKAFSDNGNIET